MIDYGTCDINNIDNCSETFIDGIKIIFKKKDIDNALAYSKLLKNKGYKVFIQPVSITSYTVTEFYNLIQKVNHINPFAMSIVDTYGLMHIDELLKYFKIIKNFLNKSIYIGYHSHNNLQLSFANCIELLRKCNRDDNIILDSTLYGMGKFAGNTNTELLSKYLNENYGKKYDIDLILQVIDEEIVKIYNKSQWGYNLSNYLSAENRCHPKYVKYLMDKDDLSIQQVTNILKRLNNNLIFDEELVKNYIKEIYCKIEKE